MKIAIVIATYQISDGKSLYYLTRALHSIKDQTHIDYKVFLIGDKYEDKKEFEHIATSIIDKDKIYFENLPVALEREKYTDRRLWLWGGINAMNIGIERSLSHGFDWVAHLDHDDYWSEYHLFDINKVIELYPDSDFIYTASTHNGLKRISPKNSSLDERVYRRLPESCNLIHSSVAFNCRNIKLRYEYNDRRGGQPGDADLWRRISGTKNINSYFVDSLTCFQPQQGLNKL